MKKVIAIVAAILIAVSASAGTGITGFLPQKTGYKKNFTPNQIADYAFDGVKPSITPSNKFWTVNYADYAAQLKDQIVTWMRAEAGDPNLSEEDAEEAFRNLPTRKTVGKVEATGLSINQVTGDILGLAQPITRDPYETVDGKGEYEIYGQTGSMSCVCANTHIGIEASQDEWEDGATSTTTKKSNSYKIPSGTNLTINITNTANGGAGGTATATATNTPAKSSGNWDTNDDPPVIIKKTPKVVYEEDDNTTTTVRTKNSGCNNCGTSNGTLVVQEKTTPGQKLYRFANTMANLASGTGTLLHGIAGYQGKLGTFVNTTTNVFNQTMGNTNDDGGDGGNLPNTPDPNDPNGDGGNLPNIRRVSGLR